MKLLVTIRKNARASFYREVKFSYRLVDIICSYLSYGKNLKRIFTNYNFSAKT